MSTTALKLGLLAWLLITSETANAQHNVSRQEYSHPSTDFDPTPPWPPELAFTYHHASTAAEGYLRGLSSVIHAEGTYLLSRYQAAVFMEYAKSLKDHNHRQWVAFCMAERERRAADRVRRKEAKRLKNERMHADKYANAYRLTSSELDRSTGAIAWPAGLTSSKYEPIRSKIDELSRRGAATKASPYVNDLVRYVMDLQRELRSDLRSVGRVEYLAATNFLYGLKLEHTLAATIN